MNKGHPSIEYFSKQIKHAAWAITFIYIVGVIVVTVHLYGYGILNLNLFRPYYIIAGMWAMALILLPVMLGAAIVSICLKRRRNDVTKGMPIALRIVGIFSLLALLFVSICLFFLSVVPFGPHTSSLRFLTACFAAVTMALPPAIVFIVAFFALIISYGISKVRESVATFKNALDKQARVAALAECIFFVGILGICFLGYLVNFAATYYSMIPAELGGGRPRDVKLVYRDDLTNKLLTDTSMFELRQKFYREGDFIWDHLVLETNEEYYLSMINHGWTQAINKKDVILVVYRQNYKSFHGNGG